MAEESTPLDPVGSGYEAERPLTLPLETEVAEGQDSGRWTLRALRDRVARFEKSAAGRFWSQLSTADFMNSSFAFAALAVLSAFPLLAVSSAAIGSDVRRVIVARMGLSPEATRDLEGLIATGDRAVATLTWLSAIVLVLGAIGMASTLQTWYARIFEQPAPKGLVRHLAYQLVGVASFTGYISFEVWLFDKVRPVGGRGLISSCSRSPSPSSSGGARRISSCTGRSRFGGCFPPGWRPVPASPVSESCLRSSSRNRSRQGRRATGLRASSWP